ncbi:MAG TPA: transglutaminase family protein [Frankiaceae bacterium]|nr:transglutaminase family protein [Frankiaceae bacterium]
MRVRIRHTTTFRYEQPASASFNELRITPRNDERQNLLSFRLTLTPKARTTEYRDHFGTRVHAFNILPPHDSLSIVGESVVVSAPRRDVPRDAGDLAMLDDPLFRDAHAEWLHVSPLAAGGDHLDTFAQHVRRVVQPKSVVELVMGASNEVHRRFEYATGASYVTSTVDDLLERGRGVCQDFAHLLISTLRDLGVPARYVSGYFFADPEPAPDVAIDVESHAWVEAFVPGFGWIEADPTNACLADERHVVVAVGRDYGDIAPIKGLHAGGGASSLDVSVTMVAPSKPVPEEVAVPPRDVRPLHAQVQQQQ